MSLVSRASLTLGLPDRGAEIHDLLANCGKPLGEWLPVPEVTNAGLAETILIYPEEGIPTPEAEELAAGFGGVTASVEEQLFTTLVELLDRLPKEAANGYYTQIREFVVRHPLATGKELKDIGYELKSDLAILLHQRFYESVPSGWTVGEEVSRCAHCGNAMRRGVTGLICRTHACAVSNRAKKAEGTFAPSDLFRVSRGIRQYWVEPGIDELRLFDALKTAGLSPELYPHRDRVDIAVGEVGIDLKTYASPETLGMRFNRTIGGLAHYPKRWVVVPNWLVVTVPSYLDRLRSAIERRDLVCLTVKEAQERLIGKAA